MTPGTGEICGFRCRDGPSVLGSNGVPYVIGNFEYDGQVPSTHSWLPTTI